MRAFRFRAGARAPQTAAALSAPHARGGALSLSEERGGDAPPRGIRKGCAGSGPVPLPSHLAAAATLGKFRAVGAGEQARRPQAQETRMQRRPPRGAAGTGAGAGAGSTVHC